MIDILAWRNERNKMTYILKNEYLIKFRDCNGFCEKNEINRMSDYVEFWNRVEIYGKVHPLIFLQLNDEIEFDDFWNSNNMQDVAIEPLLKYPIEFEDLIFTTILDLCEMTNKENNYQNFMKPAFQVLAINERAWNKYMKKHTYKLVQDRMLKQDIQADERFENLQNVFIDVKIEKVSSFNVLHGKTSSGMDLGPLLAKFVKTILNCKTQRETLCYYLDNMNVSGIIENDIDNLKRLKQYAYEVWYYPEAPIIDYHTPLEFCSLLETYLERVIDKKARESAVDNAKMIVELTSITAMVHNVIEFFVYDKKTTETINSEEEFENHMSRKYEWKEQILETELGRLFVEVLSDTFLIDYQYDRYTKLEMLSTKNLDPEQMERMKWYSKQNEIEAEMENESLRENYYYQTEDEQTQQLNDNDNDEDDDDYDDHYEEAIKEITIED